MNRKEWLPIRKLPPADRNKVRWIVRNDPEEVVASGVGVLFGREWYINLSRLPDYLQERTLKLLRKREERTLKLLRKREEQTA